MNNLLGNCTISPFTDPNHTNIVTGDIRIVQSIKLRKLLCKGSKYREPVPINFSNCKTEIGPCQVLYTVMYVCKFMDGLVNGSVNVYVMPIYPSICVVLY